MARNIKMKIGLMTTKPEYINQQNLDLVYKLAEHVIIPDMHDVKQPNRRNLISNITGEN